MTGRKGRVIAKPDGSYAYEARTKDDVPLEVLNVAEKKRFMNGEKVSVLNPKMWFLFLYYYYIFFYGDKISYY